MPEDETNTTTTTTPVAASNPPVPSLPVTAPADTLEDPVSGGGGMTTDIPVGDSPVSDTPTSDTPVADDDIADKIMNNVNVSTELSPVPPVYGDVARKISGSHNVLIALSSDPSVDEMAAAIGLSMYLDKLGKRATAIYSGATPNALEFLKPGETFAPTADTLQDFVIAINKDKADHLRYKLDGDYVKIFITPYRTRIAEDDLEFSYGDYNVDLVIALNVMNGADLDAALREHGRIMHDAVIVNATTGNPGKFGEVEWSDKDSSSISEMIAKLIYNAKSDTPVEKDEATAFMTGIVAATNRFSNAKTTPETMKIASLLMASGANQQLIAKNITPDIENELHTAANNGSVAEAELSEEEKEDDTDLTIDHRDSEKTDAADEAEKPDTEEPIRLENSPETEGIKIERSEEKPAEEPAEKPTEEPVENEVKADTLDTKAPEEAEKKVESEPVDNALLDDLKAAEASLAQTGTEATPDLSNRPVRVEDTVLPDVQDAMAAPTGPEESAAPAMPAFDASPSIPAVDDSFTVNSEEKVIQPPADLSTEISSDGTNKYGKMLEDALAGIDTSSDSINPAVMSAPEVASTPEINGVPEMNYAPQPGEDILPPPPAPPIDMDMPAPAMATDGMPFTPSMPPVQPDEPMMASMSSPEPTPAPMTIPEPMATPEPAPASDTMVIPQPTPEPTPAPAPVTDTNTFQIPGAM